MIETLWAFGKRLAFEGIPNPFEGVKRALDYPDLETAKGAIRGVGERIEREGLPNEITPLVVGIAGYGNVSRGAQEILDLLPVEEIAPGELAAKTASNKVVFKVVFKEEWSSRRRIWSNNGRGITCSTSRSTTTIPNAIAASLNATSPTWISL
jgi:alpha-aminoadipic semialdehyde synthase